MHVHSLLVCTERAMCIACTWGPMLTGSCRDKKHQRDPSPSPSPTPAETEVFFSPKPIIISQPHIIQYWSILTRGQVYRGRAVYCTIQLYSISVHRNIRRYTRQSPVLCYCPHIHQRSSCSLLRMPPPSHTLPINYCYVPWYCSYNTAAAYPQLLTPTPTPKFQPSLVRSLALLLSSHLHPLTLPPSLPPHAHFLHIPSLQLAPPT